MMKYRDNMTAAEQAQLLAECRAQDNAYAQAEAFDAAQRQDDEGERLDAYGHMNWTVGNEDWVACFDAIRVPEGISYHIVVNCESGGWLDTLETGTIAVDDKNALENLACAPEHWADICGEHYVDSPEPDMMPVWEEVVDCVKRWRKHLTELAGQSAPEDDSDSDSDSYTELRRAALDHQGRP